MKVSDGYWECKPGYNVDFAAQVYGVETDERSVTVCVPCRRIEHRALTLGGPLLTVRFTSPLENCIGVTVEHFRGAEKKEPQFVLSENTGFQPEIRRCDDGSTELISGKTSVRISSKGSEWSVTFRYDGRLLTSSGRRSLSLITEEPWLTGERMRAAESSRFYQRDLSGESAYIREMLDIGVGEFIYGLGEKFTAFVKNGQTAEIWNNDGGTNTPQSYKSVPFYISSRNYGVFVNHPEKVTFDIGSENVSKTAFTVQGERLEYFLFGGTNAGDVLRAYTDLTGKPALPPAYTFGLWLSTSFTTDYDEKTVNYFIDEMERREIPLEVFHFDCFWMKSFQWCGFQWDGNMFPDPEGLISRLKARGLKICLWINPYISQYSPIFEECLERGYFIHNRDGSVFQCDLWQPGMAVIDFTCPGAREWFASQIRKLAETGIDAIKTDFGERIPTDVVYHDGSDPYRMHNYYSYLYNKTVFEALEEAKGRGNACVFARSATAGCQQFPVHWGGDCFSDYSSMYETLRGGLSLCLSGFGFYSHDISGFESSGTPDLYKRWTAFGLLSTHSRYHGSSSYRVPWSFDEESCDVARHFVRLKGRLMPYLYRCAVETHRTGIPMMRAMFVDFGSDRSTLAIDTQYMLGDSLLAAPVFSEEGECSFYLPDCGIWTDIQTGEELPGGKWYTKKYDYFGLPLYAKPCSIIVWGDFRKSAEYDYADNMEIRIYGMEDGESAETAVYSPEGELSAEIAAVRNGDTLTVKVTGTDKPYTVVSSQGLKIE